MNIRGQLTDMANRLAATGVSSIRSSAEGPFVYAVRGGRAAQLFTNGEWWWLGMWAEEELAIDRMFDTAEGAAESAERWLSGEEA